MTEKAAENKKPGLGFLLAFVDVVFNILLGVFILYWLAQLLINDPESKKVDTPAEYLVTLEWPTPKPHDIDLWMQDAQGNIVGYQSRDSGLMSLERDDLGHSNDTITLPNGMVVTINENSEVITLRGVIPGTYKVSVHFYRNNGEDRNVMDRGEPDPSKKGVKAGTHIKVQLIRVNPKYAIVYQKEAILEQQGDEMAMFQFTFGEPSGKGISPHLSDIRDEPDHFVIMKRHNGAGRTTFEKNRRYSVYRIGSGMDDADVGH
jgi:hypothetical protein